MKNNAKRAPVHDRDDSCCERARPLGVRQGAAVQELDAPFSHERKDAHVGVVVVHHRALGAEGRYIEIRGDAGVGKSGVLKHFAEQISAEAQVIVFSPSRTVPRGWLAMRAVLGFDGTARDLLSDLAGNGSAVLFVDSLDFFGEEERLTVVDLVREAARIPGFSVIATARRDFGVAEPSWLPPEALDQLGRAEPVMIGELSDGETDELRNAAPQLIALLADNHPARPVARNLFRFSWIYLRQQSRMLLICIPTGQFRSVAEIP